MSARVIDGKAVAAAVRQEVASGVAEFQREHGRTPGLATVLIGEDEASAVYVGSKHRACEEVGMRSIGHTLPVDTTQEEAVALIEPFRLERFYKDELVSELAAAAVSH